MLNAGKDAGVFRSPQPFPLSSSATADDPVCGGNSVRGQREVVTGCSACAEHDVQNIAYSGPRRAAHIDHVAVAGSGVPVDETRHQHASVERKDLAILLSAGRPRRTDIVLAARAAFEPQ